MNNKSLLAVVVILLIGIFAVLTINAQTDGHGPFAGLDPFADSAEASAGTVQNN